MPIITIRGQLGSGAPEIGRHVADMLYAEYVDSEIITRVAELFSRPEQDVMVKEMPPGSILGRIEEALEKFHPAKPDSNTKYLGLYLTNRVIPMDDVRYVLGLESIIKDLAAKSSVVIYGRGSQFILKNQPATFHVMVVAPLKIRVERIREMMNIDEKVARKEIVHSDNSRNEFIRRYFKAKLKDAVNYDLVINTEHLNSEDAASIIVNAIVLKCRDGFEKIQKTEVVHV